MDRLDLSERDAIALTLYGEARGEQVEGRIAVACVLRNRLNAGRWGQTYSAVVQAPWQFSCWNANDPNRLVLIDLLRDPGLRERNRLFQECLWIADGILSGALISRVGAATHYYNPSAVRLTPTWVPGRPDYVVGHHQFFEHVA